MDPVMTLVAKLTLNTSEYDKNLRDAKSQMSGVGDGFKTVGDKITTGLTNAVKLAVRAVEAASAAVVGFTATAVKAGMDFDAEMSKVAAIAGATGDDFDALRTKAQEMGATTKFSATESAEAMEYMAMAGWKTEDMLSGIEGIMNLAAAAGEDLGTTSDIVTDALTAFGLTAKDSAHFADILAAASTNANTNVAMMGETFKYAAPVAGAMGYAAEDVALAIGLMANSGIKASQAGTSLRSIFTNMAKPTDTVAAAMTQLGVSLDDGQGNMYSFRDVMEQLRTSFADVHVDVEGYNAAIQELDEHMAEGKLTEEAYAQNVESLAEKYLQAADAQKASLAASLAGKYGMSGLLAIVSASEQDWNKLADAIDHSSDSIDGYNGAAEQMAAVMQDNLQGDITIFKSAMEGLQIAISDKVTPALRDFVQMGTDSISSLVTAVENGNWDGAIAIFEGFIRSLIETITNALPTIIEIGGKLIGAIGQGILDNLDPILDAAVHVVSVFAESFLNPESLKSIISASFDIIGRLANGLIEALPELIPATVEIILSITEALTDPENAERLLKGALALMVALAEGLIRSVPVIIEKIPIIVGNIVATFIGLVGEFATAAWEASVSFVTGLVDGIKQNLEQSDIGRSFLYLVETVKEAFEAIWNFLTHWWSILSEGVKLAFAWVKSSLTPFFTTIKSEVTGFFNNIKSIVTTLWEVLKNLFKTGCDVVSNVIKAFLSLIKGDWESALDYLQNALSSWWEGLKTHFKTIFEGIKDLFGTQIENAKNWGRDLLDNFISGITEKIQAVRDTVSNIAGIVKDFLGFSEPEKGPLSNFHTFAPDMMDLFAKGIKDNEDVVTKQLEKSFDFSDVLADQTVNVNGSMSGMGGNSTSFGGININVYGAEGQSENDIADAVMDRILHLMNSAGAVYA